MRRLIKRTAITLAALGVALGGAALWVFWSAGQAGETRLERWIGGQLRAVVNARLNPQLHFDAIDYQAPRTVVLTGARLLADDPGASTGRTAILAVPRLEFELDRIPAQGQPLVIRGLSVDRPVLRLLAQADGKRTTLLGWDTLVKDEPDAAGQPLSAVLRMQRVTITDGSLLIDERTGERPPMTLGGFDMGMTFDADDAGWYRFDLASGRGPMFTIDAAGRLDLDGLRLKLSPATLTLNLASEHTAALPPALQQLPTRHKARGVLRASIDGMIRLTDWRRSRAAIKLNLDDGHAAFGDYRLPIDRLALKASLTDHKLTLEQAAIETLDGRITLGGHIWLNPTFEAALTAQVADARLAQAVRSGADEDDAANRSRLTGRINAAARFNGPLARAATHAGGGGTVEVREGTLAMIPLISNLTGSIRQAGRIATGASPQLAGQDAADIAFELAGDHAELTALTLSTPLLAMEGTGRLGFDGSLYLNVRAGPITKLQQSLGLLGRGLSQITDHIVRYRVTGTLAEPRVQMLLLGAPDEKPGAPQQERQRPASELFEGIGPEHENDDDDDDEDDAWEQRREQQRGLMGP